MKKRIWLSVVAASLLSTNSFAFDVGYKNGFFIVSDDESFALNITGRIQPRLEYTDSKSEDSALSFSIRRALIHFEAVANKKTHASFALYHSTRSVNFNKLNIAGVVLEREIIPQFSVAVGMIGLPLDMMSATSSAWYLLPEAPITFTQTDSATPFTSTRSSFGAPDGVGLNFNGNVSKFFYSWSVVNGAESNYQVNPDMKFSTGARVGFNILSPVGGSMTDFVCSTKPKWTVSAGANYQGQRIDQAYADAQGAGAVAPDIKRILTASAGTGFRYAGFSAQVETYYRITSFNNFGTLPAELTTDSSLNDIGGYVALGYYIVPRKFEIALQGAEMIRQGPVNNAYAFGGGVNYYISDNNLKAQLSYNLTLDYNDVTGSQTNKRHLGVLQLQGAF